MRAAAASVLAALAAFFVVALIDGQRAESQPAPTCANGIEIVDANPSPATFKGTSLRFVAPDGTLRPGVSRRLLDDGTGTSEGYQTADGQCVITVRHTYKGEALTQWQAFSAQVRADEAARKAKEAERDALLAKAKEIAAGDKGSTLTTAEVAKLLSR